MVASGKDRASGFEFPLVTIRIPLYNHEKFIEDSLDSVTLCDYPNKELIIIDDGSTDGSANIVREWIDNTKTDFPIIFKSREHRGLTQTLNELVKMSNGEFLVSLASDDRLLPNGINQRLSYLLANKEKKAVFGDCRVINHHGSMIYESGLTELYKGKTNNYTNDDDLLREIICNWSIAGSVLMVKKSIYDDIGLYDENLFIEDWDFYLRLASRKKIGFVNDCVSEYRIHDNNTALNKNNKSRNYSQLANTSLKHFRNFPFPYSFILLKKYVEFSIRSKVYWIYQNIRKIAK